MPVEISPERAAQVQRLVPSTPGRYRFERRPPYYGGSWRSFRDTVARDLEGVETRSPEAASSRPPAPERQRWCRLMSFRERLGCPSTARTVRSRMPRYRFVS